MPGVKETRLKQCSAVLTNPDKMSLEDANRNYLRKA